MSPRIQAIPPVALQCCPNNWEYSKRTNDPPPRTAVSMDRLRFASMVNPARPTNDFANPRSGANCSGESEARVTALPAYPPTKDHSFTCRSSWITYNAYSSAPGVDDVK